MTRAKVSFALGCAVSLLLAAACGSRSEVGFGAAASGAAGIGGSVNSGGAFAAAGGAGVGVAATGGEAAACFLASDCTPSPMPCVIATCKSSACGTENVVKGTVLAQDVPADCGALTCDGQGNAVHALDFGNVPQSNEQCQVGVCDASGAPTSVPAAAGGVCKLASGVGRCDGTGKCVQCLLASDCGAGKACEMHSCVPSPACDGGPSCAASSCSDQLKNGSETDIDCGGTCPACATTLKCETDQDCTSDDCDPRTLVCLPASCIDQKRDNAETDVDCGGGCSGCFEGKKCKVNADCAGSRCDPTLLVCLGSHCTDQVEDGDESDVDCGGLDCGGCRSGQKCRSGFDCNTECLQATLRCR